MTTEINKDRLDYLLALYDMSKTELLALLNKNRKRFYTIEDIEANELNLSLLKNIDAIFKKGLSFYLDFTPISTSPSSRVLFRKRRFQATLSLEDKRIIDSFESLKSLLDGYRSLTDTSSDDHPLKGSATITEPARQVADRVRSRVLPGKSIKNHKEFLKEIIKNLSEMNLYVFEFVETWNKKERATIDGFYIAPDVIVLKRQKSYKREIFTLAHEIAHYLLGKEEIDTLDMGKVDDHRLHNNVERWCNDFAFFLIAGTGIEHDEKSIRTHGSLKPIISPLYLETMQHAFYNGLVSEAMFYKRLGCSPQ